MDTYLSYFSILAQTIQFLKQVQSIPDEDEDEYDFQDDFDEDIADDNEVKKSNLAIVCLIYTTMIL